MFFHHRILNVFRSRIALAGLFAAMVILFGAVGVRAQTPGDTDPTFGGSGVEGGVLAIAVQPDGKILIGGSFQLANGVPRGRFARLNPDGTLDLTFASILQPSFAEQIIQIVLQPDGKILIAGAFTQVGGVARGNIARLNADGTLDTTFANGLAGASGAVSEMALQPDGKIVIAGSFNQVNGVPRGRFARLNPDGTLDTPFANDLPGLAILSVALQPDGKILIGGNFSSYNGTPRGNVARVNADGTLDTTFGNGQAGANFSLSNCAVGPDGKIYIVGLFTTYNGTPRGGTARLNSDGTLDPTFLDVQLVGGSSSSIGFQADGKILVGGSFTQVNGAARDGIARLNSNGTLDTAFGNGLAGLGGGVPPFFSSFATRIVLQPDAKILVGGDFTTVNGLPRRGIARLLLGCPTITVEPTNPTLPAGTVGATYSQTFTQTGGIGTVTFTRPGGMLPDGLTFSNGVLSGTPTESGAFSFTVVATDVNGCVGSREYTLTVNPAVCPTITVGPEGSILPNGQVNGAYSQTFTQTGGAAPAGFAVTAGALPAGLTLAGDGTLTGAPTVTGTFNFTVTATDANGCTGSRAYSLSVNCQTISVAPTLATLPGGTLGMSYTQTFTQTGGVGTTVFSVSGGTLPPGLTFTPGTATLAGIPTASGTYLFSILATDANGCTGSRVYSLSVNCPILVLNPTNPTLPGGTVGAPYSEVLSVTGGTGPYNLSIVGGSLPMGISLTGGGTLAGNLTEAGNFGFTVEARDTATNCITTRAYFITIAPAATGTPVIINDRVNLVITGQSLEAATCPGYANDLVLTGTLTNTGTTTITDPFFEVIELQASSGVPTALPYRLLTASGASCGSGGLVGSQQPVGASGFVLNPGQSVSVTFRLALPTMGRLRFFVNVRGVLPVISQRLQAAAKRRVRVVSGLEVVATSEKSLRNR